MQVLVVPVYQYKTEGILKTEKKNHIMNYLFYPSSNLDIQGTG